MESVRYLVLGPVRIERAGTRISPGGRKARAVMAALLLHVGRPVSIDWLSEAIWSDDRPAVHHALHTHVSRIRRLIGDDRVVQVDGSYRLDADPGDVDARRVERLIGRAADHDEPGVTRALCSEALGMWRGPPYGELGDLPFLQTEVRRLETLRMSAIEFCNGARLALGHHRQAVVSLVVALSEFPFNETLWKLYMLALVGSGRRPEALMAYDELQLMLSEELAVEPGPELRALRDEIAAS